MARQRSRPAPSMRAAPARAPAPAPQRAAPPAPQQQHSNVPMQAPTSGGGGSFLGSMASTMAQGFAFGTGSAVAREMVHGVMNSGGSSNSGQQEVAAAPAPQYQAPPSFQQQPSSSSSCTVDQQNFMACLNQNQGNVDACQFYFESLQNCQRNSYAGAQLS